MSQCVAIITGAGQGIGYEVARQLGSRGVAVWLNDLDPTLAETAAQRLRAEGCVCEAAPGNAAEVDFVRTLVQRAVARFGRLDFVVANAGMTTFGNFFDYPAESLQTLLDLNLRGTFFLTQAAARQFRQQGGGGRVVLMSSATGHQAHAFLAAYAMTKAALEMLAKALVAELSPHGITINCVAPGATQTERTLNDPDYTHTWSRITPLGRPATVADVAGAVCYFLSDAAAHVTGQSLVVDGGWTSLSPSPYE